RAFGDFPKPGRSMAMQRYQVDICAIWKISPATGLAIRNLVEPFKRPTMNTANVFNWFASESARAAEKTDDVNQREKWSRLALLWAAAAQQGSEETVTTQATRSA